MTSVIAVPCYPITVSQEPSVPSAPVERPAPEANRKPESPHRSKSPAAVQKAKARKRSGETDDTWRKEYAASLKVGGNAAPMSSTPFAGEAFKKKT